jgi:MFS family permease
MNGVTRIAQRVRVTPSSVDSFGIARVAAPPRRPRLVHAAILLFTAGLSSLATAVLGPSLPKMQAHFASAPHADYLVPLSLTLPMLMMACLSVVAGLAADRVGRKKILVAATVAYALCGMAPLWLDSLNAVLASRILLGVAEASVMTVSTTMIGDYFSGALRAKLMSLHTTFAAVSAFFLNIVGGVLGDRGWRAPYVVYGISLPLALLMAHYLWETKPAGAQPDAAGMEIDDLPFRVRRLLGICLVAACVGVAFLTVPVHLGYFFAALGEQSSARIGVAFALNSVGVMIGTLSFGWIVGPRLESVALQLAIAVGILALSFIEMAAAAHYLTLTLAAAVNGIGMGLLLPTIVTWNMRELPFSHRGLGVGAFQSSLFLGMFFNPVLVVSLEKYLGSRVTGVGAMGLALLVASMIAAWIGSRSPPSSAE